MPIQAGPTDGVVHYDDVAPTLQTGDVALFHGNSWISKAIQKATGNPYSHVGMVVRIQDVDPGGSIVGADPDKVYFFESTLRRESLPDYLDHFYDIEKGEPPTHPGVQLVLLRDAFSHYDCQKVGTFNVRRLRGARTPEMRGALSIFMRQVDRRPFPKLVQMLAHWLEGLFGWPCSLNTFFCAELVAASYQHMGILPGIHPPNHYAPGDFSSERDGLPLEGGYEMGDEVVVVLN